MEVVLFGGMALVFAGLFLWAMITAARRGSMVVAALCGALALSNPLAFFAPFVLVGGTNALLGVLLIAACIGGTAWLAYRAYRSGVIARRAAAASSGSNDDTPN